MRHAIALLLARLSFVVAVGTWIKCEQFLTVRCSQSSYSGTWRKKSSQLRLATVEFRALRDFFVTDSVAAVQLPAAVNHHDLMLSEAAAWCYSLVIMKWCTNVTHNTCHRAEGNTNYLRMQMFDAKGLTMLWVVWAVQFTSKSSEKPNHCLNLNCAVHGENSSQECDHRRIHQHDMCDGGNDWRAWERSSSSKLSHFATTCDCCFPRPFSIRSMHSLIPIQSICVIGLSC